MRVSSYYISIALLLASGLASAASQWNFRDATVSISGSKGGDGLKENLSDRSPLAKAISLDPSSTMKILLTTHVGSTPKRPHQVFLSLQDPSTGLETHFPFTIKENGKAKVDITHKDLPLQLLLSPSLRASLLLGSFGGSKPLITHLFDLDLERDSNLPLPKYEKPLRYGKKGEIHDIFRDDPQSPPKIISAVFVLAILGTVPVLLGAWIRLGANLSHLGKASSAAPLSYALYFGSILGMEGLFLLYYTSWNLFQVLPIAGVISVITILSGSKALSEVQGRRLDGLR